MNNAIIEQAKRIRRLSDFIKIRVESLDDLSSNNVIAELKEIADVLEEEASKEWLYFRI